MNQTISRKLNFAILGTGHIAAKMAKTLDFLRDEINPYAVASRSLEKSKKLAEANCFAKAYGSYAEMLSDPEVDVVYIATPNTFHFEHAKMCLSAGKHIICEKPFTMKASEADEIFALARERKLFVLEAVWTRFQPAVKSIRDIITSGEIGAPRFIQAMFGLAVSGKDRMKLPSLGGGALYDLGIYAIHFAAMYFGLDSIRRISSAATLSPDGVDDQSTITIEYNDGRMASLATSMTAAYGTSSRIAGTLGFIDAPQLTRSDYFRVCQIPSNASRDVTCLFDFNGYEYEIRAAARAIADGRLECEEMPWSETLAVTRLMENLTREWGYCH